ncbi:unnamed protein product, partial [Didymodactylos carnosus]
PSPSKITATAQTICERFQILLQQLFDKSSFDLDNQLIYELSILLPQEIKLLQDINNTTHIDSNDTKIKCIHHEFVQQSMRYSQKIAIILDEQSLTYEEVLYYVQKLSRYLINVCSVENGDIICVCVQRSTEFVIGILAILTCGCSYCPLNINDPVSRLSILIKETRTHCVLIHSRTENKLLDCITGNDDVKFVNIEQIIYSSESCHSSNELNIVSSKQVTTDDIAYVIFTSGSTGKPKAVQIRHRNFISYMRSLKQLELITKNDIVIQLAQCSFDVHLEEVVGSLILGATVIMLQSNKNMDINYLLNIIRYQKATYISLTPTFIIILCDFLQETKKYKSIQSLRTIILG